MIRLKVSIIGGDVIGVLPTTTDISWYTRKTQGGSLTFKHSAIAPGYGSLDVNKDTPVELTVELANSTNNGWIEPRDARFLISQESWERIEDQGLIHSYECRSLAQELSAALVDTKGIDADGNRVFNAVSPGAIMQTLINEAKDRGCFPWLNIQIGVFNTTYSKAYKPTDSLWSVLTSLVDAGLVDWYMQGRTLHILMPNRLGINRTAGQNQVYIRDVQLGAAPEKVSTDGILTHALILGDDGRIWRRETPGASTKWGRREGAVSLGGISDEAVAYQTADGLLFEGKEPKYEYTREWSPYTLPYLPGRDFDRGDWILIDTPEEHKKTFRIYDMSVSIDQEQNVKAFCTLGSVHDELVVRLARRSQALDGSIGVASQGRPSEVPKDRKDIIPATINGITILPSTSFDDAGFEIGSLLVNWPTPTISTTGADLSQATFHYSVAYKESDWTNWTNIRATEKPIVIPNLTVGKTYNVRIQSWVAWSNVPSAWSSTAVVTIEADKIPPEAPSAPIVTSTMSLLQVEWDGKSASNQNMAIDFSHLKIYVDNVDKGFYDHNAGPWLSDDYNIGSTATVQLSAVDRSGNESSKSAPVTITIDGVDGDRIKAGSVTAGKLSATAIDGKIITGSTIRSSAGANRTELTDSGINIYRNNELKVSLSHRNQNGLAIRHPKSLRMIEASNMIYGCGFLEWTGNWNQNFNSNGWAPGGAVATGESFFIPGNELIVMAHFDWGLYGIRSKGYFWVSLINANGQEVASKESNFFENGRGNEQGNNAVAHRLYNITPGMHKLRAVATAQGGPTSGGYYFINRVSMVALPR